jgi:hypothetical protein
MRIILKGKLLLDKSFRYQGSTLREIIRNTEMKWRSRIHMLIPSRDLKENPNTRNSQDFFAPSQWKTIRRMSYPNIFLPKLQAGRLAMMTNPGHPKSSKDSVPATPTPEENHSSTEGKNRMADLSTMNQDRKKDTHQIHRSD